MKVEDFKESKQISDFEQILPFLNRRNAQGQNNIWIGDDYPALNILIENDMAYIHYFPTKGHPGFRSISDKNIEGTTVFDTNELIEILNESLVPMKEVKKVVNDFLFSGALLQCISWQEL